MICRLLTGRQLDQGDRFSKSPSSWVTSVGEQCSGLKHAGELWWTLSANTVNTNTGASEEGFAVFLNFALGKGAAISPGSKVLVSLTWSAPVNKHSLRTSVIQGSLHSLDTHTHAHMHPQNKKESKKEKWQCLYYSKETNICPSYYFICLWQKAPLLPAPIWLPSNSMCSNTHAKGQDQADPAFSFSHVTNSYESRKQMLNVQF